MTLNSFSSTDGGKLGQLLLFIKCYHKVQHTRKCNKYSRILKLNFQNHHYFKGITFFKNIANETLGKLLHCWNYRKCEDCRVGNSFCTTFCLHTWFYKVKTCSDNSIVKLIEEKNSILRKWLDVHKIVVDPIRIHFLIV